MEFRTYRISEQEELSLAHSIHWSVSTGDIHEQWMPASGHKHFEVPGHKIAYSIRPPRKGRGEALWLVGSALDITGRVESREPLPGWKVGITQSIIRCERNARYKDGAARLTRLNTRAGPLKDGDEGALFYPGAEETAERLTTTSLNDNPNWETPIEFQGQRLVRTFGSDQFRSFLILAREQDKSIVVLGGVQWTIDWSGLFDPANVRHPWRPYDADRFLSVSPIKVSRVFANLRANQHEELAVPFSLNMCEAERFFEIQEGGQWKACNASGDTERGRKHKTRSWLLT